jgi:hypothetical protein
MPVAIKSKRDDPDALERDYGKLMLKFEDEEKKIMKDIEKSERNIFSDKSRGSVPLLETTFVIRGGTPRERQSTKRILDIIGAEPPLKDFNTIRIVEDQDQPVVFEDEKTISVKDTTLHVKGDVIPADLAVMMLTLAYKLKSPQVSDENASMYAKKVVYSAIEDMTARAQREKELESIEVYQPGAETQPTYEIESAPAMPVQATIVSAQPETIVPQEKDARDRLIESEKSSLYYTGGL